MIVQSGDGAHFFAYLFFHHPRLETRYARNKKIHTYSQPLYAISDFSLYGECVVRSFFPNVIFLPCDHGLDF